MMYAWEGVTRQRRALEIGKVMKNSRKLYVIGIPTALLYDLDRNFSAISDHRFFINLLAFSLSLPYFITLYLPTMKATFLCLLAILTLSACYTVPKLD